MTCCNNILDLARITCCLGKLSLGVNAAHSGVYRLEADFLGSVQVIEQAFAQGDNLKFDLKTLNESYVFIARIYDPNGGQVTKDIDGRVYECFSFETVFVYGKTETPEGLQPSISELHFDDFTGGVYTGLVDQTRLVFHTGLADFLTSGQWSFVYDSGNNITGVHVLVSIGDADIIYLFK